MLKIRLRRMGKKKAPTYRIIVADALSPRDGRFVEEIGIYDPNPAKAFVRIDAEAAAKWLSNGAQPTDVVAKLFKAQGIDRNYKPAEEAESVVEEAPAEEAAPAAEEAPAETESVAAKEAPASEE